jgi:hypothetical protein
MGRSAPRSVCSSFARSAAGSRPASMTLDSHSVRQSIIITPCRLSRRAIASGSSKATSSVSQSEPRRARCSAMRWRISSSSPSAVAI